jgi:CheY-like chemotaxis protein
MRGHPVRTAERLAEASEVAEGWRFDLLLSGIEPPDGTGLELMGRLRGRGVPGVAMSGHGTGGDVRQVRAAVFAEHLTKPVDVRRLAESIRRATAPVGSEDVLARPGPRGDPVE